MSVRLILSNSLWGLDVLQVKVWKCLKSESVPKNFIDFKAPLGFYKNLKDAYTTL